MKISKFFNERFRPLLARLPRLFLKFLGRKKGKQIKSPVSGEIGLGGDAKSFGEQKNWQYAYAWMYEPIINFNDYRGWKEVNKRSKAFRAVVLRLLSYPLGLLGYKNPLHRHVINLYNQYLDPSLTITPKK